MKAIFETLGKSEIQKKREEKYADWKGQNVCVYL